MVNHELHRREFAAGPAGRRGRPQADAAAQPQGWFPPPPPPPPRPQECRPGTYSCTVNKNGWRVCDVSGRWVFGGYCSRNTECKYNWQNGSPYCVPRY
ncbi:hypothetical protein NEMBOFW57_001900 [Staphylotrichum longicolle]|uniref:Uncharacterized protein n=1 Tax=Staphylotrichum longicolle TaxID=669026 RepID=A0AAD4F6Z0_9PEZI|nr:hypothetical protein NEMBOFW57_001900 [Staphylotrichum longicolle]